MNKKRLICAGAMWSVLAGLNTGCLHRTPAVQASSQTASLGAGRLSPAGDTARKSDIGFVNQKVDTPVHSATASGSARLLVPGKYPRRETDAVGVQDGQSWLGLFRSGKTGGRFQWQPCRARVRTVPQPYLDFQTPEQERADRGGRAVSVADGPDDATAVLLTRGLPQVRSGAVNMVFSQVNLLPGSGDTPSDSEIQTGKPTEFVLNGQTYTMQVVDEQGQPAEFRSAATRPGVRLRLTQGAREQNLLLSGKNIVIDSVSVRCAGDLDSDGKLDFYLDVDEWRGRNNAIEAYQLWLSSKAAPGQMVGKAAEFTTEADM